MPRPPIVRPEEAKFTTVKLPGKGEIRVVIMFRDDYDRVLSTDIVADRWSCTQLLIGRLDALPTITHQFGGVLHKFAKELFDTFGLGSTKMETRDEQRFGPSNHSPEQLRSDAGSDHRLPEPEPGRDLDDEQDQGGG